MKSEHTIDLISEVQSTGKKILALEQDHLNFQQKTEKAKADFVLKLENEKSSFVKKNEEEIRFFDQSNANEYASFQKSNTEKLKIIQDELNKKIKLQKDELELGMYIPNALKVFIDEHKKKISLWTTITIVICGAGILLLGVLYFVNGNDYPFIINKIKIPQWVIGIILTGIGLILGGIVLNGLYNTLNPVEAIFRSGKLSFNKGDIANIIYLSDDFTQLIAAERKACESRINTSVSKLTKEYDAKKYEITNSSDSVKSKKQSEYEAKRSQMKSEYEKNKAQLIFDTDQRLRRYLSEEKTTISERKIWQAKELAQINEDLENFSRILNQYPETFDSKSLDWSEAGIMKGKDFLFPYLRIGNETIEVNFEGKNQSFELPRLISFYNKSNIVINCTNPQETEKGTKVSHNIIARTLLALKASKVKLTFIDPLELGANASPFTPLLKDINGGMVYTQQSDIDTQLSNLTRAIENVIQKYLQDKFIDIAEYNNKTQEVPEPYRFLVVYNFPHGFNDTSINKLLNIIKSGPRAGIHTILINDKGISELPYKFSWNTINSLSNITEIKLNSAELFAGKGKFKFGGILPYEKIVKYVNEEFPKSSTLKVNAVKYIPDQSQWWKDKTNNSFEVPIGRHGTEMQNLRYNNDVHNQALLIGKPGSGKSNLLHVIIANSLWKYSPDQLEIYLIDFKGGVEFTIYADKKIPHIRTIAIESEREFGLSVLDGVERELFRREKEFSNNGVQNIAQYHEKYPDQYMPRILLIVDEFQEFYVEDDAIKQQVDDKFDRIVKKGRAFGINTLFSSQTLSGNSIKKSTRELIDIRLALICSETDANLILDDKNLGARDLTRPGEGIYNSENGKVAGNKKFQAFFIEKEDLIRTIDAVVTYSNSQQNGKSHHKQIIFRGSEKAYLETKVESGEHDLSKITPIANPKSLKLWLGEPVAIADDVKATIRKQAGSNFLIAGSDESIGVRVMASAIISIAAQHLANTAKFYCFNFYNVDSDLIEIPNELFNNIEHESISVSNRDVKEKLNEIKVEIENRINNTSNNKSNIYLSFFSIQRCRALRKDGYSLSEEGNTLSYILKEGADVGVFCLVQVDTMDSFSKNLDDNLLKEFSQRVATQMNPENSHKIIGSHKASKLGNNRALYFDDNENYSIKFKPYELPQFHWVAQLQSKSSTLS